MYTTEETWISVATVIYIDQPIGTGFASGTPLLTDMEDVTEEFVFFMKQLWETFPALKTKNLFVTGESYAGHYIPAFSYALVQDGRFNLQASLIGDPYTAGLTQKQEMYKVPEALNILDDSNMPQIAALRKNCAESVVGDYKTSYETCCKIMDYISDVSGDVFAYDQRIFAEDWDPKEQIVIDYFSNAATN